MVSSSGTLRLSPCSAYFSITSFLRLNLTLTSYPHRLYSLSSMTTGVIVTFFADEESLEEIFRYLNPGFWGAGFIITILGLFINHRRTMKDSVPDDVDYDEPGDCCGLQDPVPYGVDADWNSSKKRKQRELRKRRKEEESRLLETVEDGARSDIALVDAVANVDESESEAERDFKNQ